MTAWVALMMAVAAGRAPALPVVTFAHNGILELYCAQVSPAKPDPAVVAEIDARVDDFQAAWAKDGPRRMAQTVALAGRPYPFRDSLATLSGCPDFPTTTIPLVVNVVRFTRAYGASAAPAARTAIISSQAPSGPRTVRPMSDFVHDAWYALTMQYVRAIRRAAPEGTTPLLRKYAGESRITQRNLHVAALDELVSDRLGERAEFDRRVAELRSRNATDLVRAFDIVHQEGAEKFVAELRRPSSLKP